MYIPGGEPFHRFKPRRPRLTPSAQRRNDGAGPRLCRVYADLRGYPDAGFTPIVWKPAPWRALRARERRPPADSQHFWVEHG